MRIWIEKWMAVHAVLLFCSTFYFLFTYQIEVIGIAALLTFSAFYLIKYFKDRKSDFFFEAANMVSGIRCLLLIVLLFFSFNGFLIGFIALCVLVMDGMDGYYARKYKAASDFGAALDVETDAFYVLALGSLLYQDGVFGPWILLLGLLRYLYFIALLFVKPPQQKEKRFYRGKQIEVILMSSMIAGFLLPLSIAKPVIVISSLFVFYSYGMSFWIVLKQKPH